MTEATEKTKKPSDSAFKQQRLTAWQPILTAGTVLPTFFVIGILFIPVGIGLLVFSDKVKEYSFDYTNCNNTNGQRCAAVVEQTGKPCMCKPIDVVIEEDLQNNVYVYYALTNFYQNHRRYVKSRDDKQLLGFVGSPDSPAEPDSACEPYRFNMTGTGAAIGVGGEKKIYFPCGAIANSMFSDKIELYKNGVKVPLTSKDIAWDSDKTYKFDNPKWWGEAVSNPDHPAWKKFEKPKDWTDEFWKEWQKTGGLKNEDFIVWMRTAALPNFRKLYRVLDRNSTGYVNGLQKGNYTLHITYSFKVDKFQGTKSVVISTTSLLGGKNPFLGISYIVVGAICLVLGIVFLFIHIKNGKSTWEMTNVDSRTSY